MANVVGVFEINKVKEFLVSERNYYIGRNEMINFIKFTTLICLIGVFATVDCFGQTRKAGVRKPVRGQNAPATANTFDSALKLATISFQKKDYIAAIRLAKKAVEFKDDDFRPFNILSNAFFRMESFDEALPNAQIARKICPEEMKGELDVLIRDISESKAVAEQIKVAESAIAQNDAPKAAEGYRAAFLLMPTREDLGLKAASIYNDQIKNYGESVRLASQIALKTKDPAMSAQAKDLLGIAEENLRQEKQEIARKQVQQQRLEAEKEREQKASQARTRIEELETKKDGLQTDMEYEQEWADRHEQDAEKYEAEAARYDGQQFGAIAAGISRMASRDSRKKSNQSRSKARQLQSEISQIDREIARLQRDSY